MIELNEEQRAMLAGEMGQAKQMGMRLVLDLAAAAGAEALVPINHAHLSGVSPLTGGLGLRLFLQKLGKDESARVAIPTTLNSAGCDSGQFEAMRIVAPDFLDHNQEIVASYAALGVRPTQSCIPYEWDGVETSGVSAWAESNAICYGNSYTDLLTNRESGLSALAAALTGYTPEYGLLTEGALKPNLLVTVTAEMTDPTDYSILGDWIGSQRTPEWETPWGPMPIIRGLPAELNHEQKKALTAAAANYGSPQLYIEGHTEIPEDQDIQDELIFSDDVLAARYEDLQPNGAVALITIGCPQASVGELKAVAELVKGKQVRSEPAGSPQDPPPLWVFTSARNRAIAEQTGIAKIITDSGALLLADTCPEVVPYDSSWVKQVLTNSMKAEHYIKSGLNGIPTAVMNLADCITIATGEQQITGDPIAYNRKRKSKNEMGSGKQALASGAFTSAGHGLPSQTDFSMTGTAFVTNTPITLLGFVNRETGEIDEPGHPADGQSMADKIAIFPKGSGSTVAPYVLLELIYRGKSPLAIVNTDIDQQSAPACSLEGVPYAYNFDADIIAGINDGDKVELTRVGSTVTLKVVERVGA